MGPGPQARRRLWRSWPAAIDRTLDTDLPTCEIPHPPRFARPNSGEQQHTIERAIAYESYRGRVRSQRNFPGPFSPSFIVDAFLYRIGPKPYTYEGNFDFTLWMSLINAGATAGELDDLAIKVQFPKGDLVLQPVLFVSSPELFKSALKGADTVPFEAPFTKLFVPAKGQINKAIIFRPLNWNPKFVERVRFRVSICAQFREGKTQLVTDELPLILTEEQVNDWKAGKPVIPQVELIQDMKWYKALTPSPNW